MIQDKSTDEAVARLLKLKNFEKAGVEPYPTKSTKTTDIKDVVKNFKTLEKQNKKIQLVGRIRTLRVHGGLAFITIEDESDQIQVALQKKNLKEYKLFTDNLDMGDFIEIKGPLFLTHKGEKTLNAMSIRLLSKALLPLPEKWHGLSDIETRFRQRYLDMLSNPSVRHTFQTRSTIIKSIRQFLDDKGFLEVDTPILQPLAGGATAKPFKTHHNALNTDLFLRIAPELYLKRLLVGGFEKVYEISRCFRNEGIDHSHNPEFTQVEFYWAYSEYEALMKMTENFLEYIGKQIKKDLKFEFDKKKFSLKAPYKRITFRDAILKTAKIDIDKVRDRDKLATLAKKAGVKVEKSDGYGKILDEIFKKHFREKVVEPTFVYDYPIELSPLAKKKPGSDTTVERFQLLVAGTELCNAFSELNDPLDQEARFKDQEKARKAGDEEAQQMDKDYVTALKHGMPPASGFGMGIDRLTMLLTNNHSVKEVIMFPTLRPEKE
ncbi:lysine--tRNA ligase [Candidatus Parcubacteria bacterium]|nr:lysine--tRNA ligase [Patescibacteria group bacterium]MCG2693808.1 lysine--tRNA ligase [Candidatus Parcubacteria bacterium]